MRDESCRYHTFDYISLFGETKHENRRARKASFNKEYIVLLIVDLPFIGPHPAHLGFFVKFNFIQSITLLRRIVEAA